MEKEEKATEGEFETDSYEFVSDNDAKSIEGTDVASTTSQRRTSSLDSGVPLSATETFLAKRVRDLKQENDELKRAIHDNDEALQLCLKSLNTWKDEQRDAHYDLLKKHDQASKTVSRLQNESISLKQQLGYKIKRLSDAEAQLSNQQNGLENLEKENVALKSVQSILETNIGCLQEHVNKVVNLSDIDCQKLAAPGSTFFQDLVQICKEIEKTVKLIVNPVNVNILPLQEELQSEKAKCISLKEQLKQEKLKQFELEKKNKELEKRIEVNSLVSPAKKMAGFGYGSEDVKELEEEVQLMKRDVEKIEMVEAGCVSHGSETTTEDSFTSQQAQKEGNKSFDSLSYEEEIYNLKKKSEKLKALMDRREASQLGELEKALAEKKKLEIQLENSEAEKSSIGKQLQEIIAKKLETEKEQKEDLNMIQQLLEKQKELEIANQVLEQQQHEIATLKSQICSFFGELQKKEEECEQWTVQELDMQQKIKHMDMMIGQLKNDIKCSESALLETRNELSSVYAQNEKLLAENQSYRGASGAEVAEFKSKIDNLTAQLLSAEEMVENKEQDYRKLQHDHANLTSELETVPLLKQQIEVFQTDFTTEQQTRQKREEDCKRLRDEVAKLRAENEKLNEELNDTTGSNMAEMQRRHRLGTNNYDRGPNAWNQLYDSFLAPRGPAGRNAPPPQRPLDTDANRQVSGGCCPKCDQMFPDLDALQVHVVECLESESTPSAGQRVCPKCQGIFPDLDTLQIHVMECLDN